MSTFTIFSAFLQGLGIVAIAVRLHEMAIARCVSARCENTAAALTFAAGVIVSMGFPLNFAPGIIFDLRHVFLVIAGIYGGWPAILFAAFAAVAFRLMEGGVGMAAGLAGIGISTVIGLMAASLRRSNSMPLRGLIPLGFAASLSLVSVFLLPWTIAVDVFGTIGLPFVAINLFGVVIAGESFNKTRKQHVREKALVRDTATDALTGLANRRAFDVEGPEMAQLEMRRQGRYAIMVVDVDNFKSINDTFGHAAGDRVLRDVSAAIAGSARDDDLVARFGGEEIVLVLPGCDELRARGVANRIREGVEATVFDVEGIRLKVTVSVGYVVNDNPAKTFWANFEEADAALYRAKNTGRNRVVCGIAA